MDWSVVIAALNRVVWRGHIKMTLNRDLKEVDNVSYLLLKEKPIPSAGTAGKGPKVGVSLDYSRNS